MAIGGGVPNQYLLFALGVEALTTPDGLSTYYSVQRRHPDGSHWIDVAHFAGRDDAEAAVRRLVGHDELTDDDLRVEKVTREIV